MGTENAAVRPPFRLGAGYWLRPPLSCSRITAAQESDRSADRDGQDEHGGVLPGAQVGSVRLL